MSHIGHQCEMRFVRSADRLHGKLGFCLVNGVEHLLIGEQRCVVRGLAGAGFRGGEPHNLLADHRQGAGDAHNQHKEPDRQGEPTVNQKPKLGAGLFGHGKRQTRG